MTAQQLSRTTRARLATLLLAWYDAHRRDLPWRRTRDPYAVWVSEMMLQQTQVATVVGYFERWMRLFPTVHALAAAEEQDVLGAWQGLGYYSRARNLRRGAQVVVRDHGGRVPDDPDVLRTLPGLGPYSAGAIASIAYQRRAPVVDGNVARVFCRLLALEGDPKQASVARRLWARAAELVPSDRPGDFNQALMELGATVCTPRTARCPECPLSTLCRAHREGLVEVLPHATKRRATVIVSRVAAVVRRSGRYLVVQVPENSPRWGGLWVFPTADVEDDDPPDRALTRAATAAGLRVAPGAIVCTIKHAFTHHRITLTAIACQATGTQRRKSVSAARWCTPDELPRLPMPAPYRRIAQALMDARDPATSAGSLETPGTATSLRRRSKRPRPKRARSPREADTSPA